MRNLKRSAFPLLTRSVACAAIWGAVTGIVKADETPYLTKSRIGLNDSPVIGSSEPFFEQWDKGGLGLHGTLSVAMDGTVLMFGRGGGKDIHEIFLRRSEDGGATWSARQQIGKSIEMDWKSLGIGPYDGKGWGNDKHFAYATLGTSVVDENTGEIMVFMTSLHPVPFMYKSQDHGKTWKLEKIVLHKDSRGFCQAPTRRTAPASPLNTAAIKVAFWRHPM